MTSVSGRYRDTKRKCKTLNANSGDSLNRSNSTSNGNGNGNGNGVTNSNNNGSHHVNESTLSKKKVNRWHKSRGGTSESVINTAGAISMSFSGSGRPSTAAVEEIIPMEDNELNVAVLRELPPLFPLESEWTFWYDRREKANRRTLDEMMNYEGKLQAVATVKSIQGFWLIYNQFLDVANFKVDSNMHFFRAGVRPLWEDPFNQAGGKWVLTIRSPHYLNELWRDLLLAVIGGEIFDKGDIAGCVMSRRSRGDKIALWTRDDSNILRIGCDIVRVFGMANVFGDMSYQYHSEARQSGHSFFNKAHLNMEDIKKELARTDLLTSSPDEQIGELDHGKSKVHDKRVLSNRRRRRQKKNGLKNYDENLDRLQQLNVKTTSTACIPETPVTRITQSNAYCDVDLTEEDEFVTPFGSDIEDDFVGVPLVSSDTSEYDSSSEALPGDNIHQEEISCELETPDIVLPLSKISEYAEMGISSNCCNLNGIDTLASSNHSAAVDAVTITTTTITTTTTTTTTIAPAKHGRNSSNDEDVALPQSMKSVPVKKKGRKQRPYYRGHRQHSSRTTKN